MRAVHTFTVDHATVRILPDDDSSHLNPCDSGDDNVIFATLERNSTLRPDWARSPEDIAEYAKEHDMWELPLWKFEHGGKIYRVTKNGNPFYCPWDSGRVGSVLLAKLEWPDESVAESYADAFCEEVTDWCNGNVHGYVIDVPDEENVDACWGFIGDRDSEHIIAEATEAAKYASGEYAKRLESERETEARELESERPDMYESAKG